MPPTTSRTLRAQQKESRVYVEANLCPTTVFFGENRHVANAFFVHRPQILYLLIFTRQLHTFLSRLRTV